MKAKEIARILFIAAMLAVCNASWGAVPRNGLVGEWLFGGNANDTSGHGNNGVVNGATLTADRFGRPKAAYDFIGTNDNSITTSFVPPNKISLSLWYNAASSQLENAGLFSTYSGSNYYGIYYGTSNTDEWIRTDANDLHFLAGAPNKWVHLVVTSSNSKINVYKDGKLVLSFSGSTTHADSLIFGDSRFNGRYFTGALDDIRLYNRALTSAEIMALYQEYNIAVSAFTATPTAGSSPLEVNFTVRAKSPYGNIVKYLWDVDGDGNADQITEVPELSYTYGANGIYNASVQVADSAGYSGKSGKVKVTVSDGTELNGRMEYFEYDDVTNTVHIKVRVYNTGNLAAGKFNVTFVISDNGKGASTFNTSSVTSIAVGQNTLLDVTKTFPSSIQGRQINIAIDSARKIKEVDETNNGSKILFVPVITR